MKKPWLPICLLASLSVAILPRNCQALSFEIFRGTFDQHGTMKITNGESPGALGTAKLVFQVGAHKANGRLKITGALQLDDTVRPVSVNYLFKLNRVAAVSNLAPGIDDGRNAKGTFKVLRSRITANAPFDLKTVSGMAKVTVRVRSRPHGATLEVVQTLSTTALAQPIVWKFKAAAIR